MVFPSDSCIQESYPEKLLLLVACVDRSTVRRGRGALLGCVMPQNARKVTRYGAKHTAIALAPSVAVGRVTVRRGQGRAFGLCCATKGAKSDT